MLCEARALAALFLCGIYCTVRFYLFIATTKCQTCLAIYNRINRQRRALWLKDYTRPSTR